MTADIPQLRVCFVCNTSVRAKGGTAAYERFLATELAKTCSVSAVARYVQVPAHPRLNYADGEGPGRFDDGPVTTTLLPPRPRWMAGALRRLPSLLSRPRLTSLAEALHRIAYRTDLARVIPRDTQVVHYIGTGWEVLGSTAETLSRRIGAAFVVTPFVHPGQWGDSDADVKFYRRADAVIVASDVEATHLAARGLPTSKMHKIGLGPGSDRVGDGTRFRSERGLGDRPLVLFIARRQRYKGYHVLREAMSDVLQAVPAAALVVIGPEAEPPYPPLPDSAVVDLGTLSWSDDDQQLKADALAACNVLAMPSSGEAFGIVYVEAWSCGKPVIGGPAPAVLELIGDGVNGLHVTQTRASIADALLRILSDARYAAAMGAAGQHSQAERYNWTAVSAATLSVYSARQSASAPCG